MILVEWKVDKETLQDKSTGNGIRISITNEYGNDHKHIKSTSQACSQVKYEEIIDQDPTLTSFLSTVGEIQRPKKLTFFFRYNCSQFTGA